MSLSKKIAIYLPQYHPIPENDEWWGKGFTEWFNVTKAKPLFDGHYQPHLPADLGFYDLRLDEARLAQEALAKKYGIYGFCYYHYWFTGKRMLYEPIERKLKNLKEELPFMLCWANENWSRRWDGLENEVLLEQNYSSDDDEKHMEYLIQFFKDPRYIRVNNKPVFILYKHFLLPDATATARKWRSIAAKNGLELYLCHMIFGYRKDSINLIDGFDAAIDFEPFGVRRSQSITTIKKHLFIRFLNKMVRMYDKEINKRNKLPIIEYESMYRQLTSLKEFGFKIYPSLVPGWDNTSRRKNSPTLILNKSTPDKYQEWLRKILDDFSPYSCEENFVFINAWNEWAEGNHLEPCQKWGNKYLEATRAV